MLHDRYLFVHLSAAVISSMNWSKFGRNSHVIMTPTFWVDYSRPACPLLSLIHTNTIIIFSIYQQNIESVPADDHHNTTQKLFYDTHTYIYVILWPSLLELEQEPWPNTQTTLDTWYKTPLFVSGPDYKSTEINKIFKFTPKNFRTWWVWSYGKVSHHVWSGTMVM